MNGILHEVPPETRNFSSSTKTIAVKDGYQSSATVLVESNAVFDVEKNSNNHSDKNTGIQKLPFQEVTGILLEKDHSV